MRKLIAATVIVGASALGWAGVASADVVAPPKEFPGPCLKLDTPVVGLPCDWWPPPPELIIKL